MLLKASKLPWQLFENKHSNAIFKKQYCQQNILKNNFKMATEVIGRLEENIKEVIILSDLIRNQDFRACFVAHFANRVCELENISSKIDVKISQRLQLKLLDPLIFHLRTTTNSSDKCIVIQCINQVLKITLIDSVSAFFDVYTMIFFQIFKGGNLPYRPSEELQECVLECCSFLLKNATPNVIEKVYTQENGAKFSLGISISINIVKEERSIKLRMAALNFLLEASKFENHVNYTKDIYNKVADLFILYLPGILGPLLEVILRDETQHHSITTKALTCWGHILCLVMRDSAQSERPSDDDIVKQWLVSPKGTGESGIDISTGLKERKRSKLWLESAEIVLHPLVMKLIKIIKHSHPKCRLELVLLMVKLIKNCLRNLKKCLPIIMDVLITLAVDEDAEVCQAAEEALNELQLETDKKNIGFLVPVLEENLYSVINKLPGVLQSGNEQSLLLSLKSLSGYLKTLGRQNRLQHLISLSSTLKKLISVVKISFELEVYLEISNQDFSVWDSDVDLSCCHKPWKRFRHFTSPLIQNQLEEICRDLTNFGHSEIIFDFLLETYAENCSFRKETLLVLNEIILGSDLIEEYALNQLLEFYLKPENFSLPLQYISDCVTPREAQVNIIKVALLVEGIGNLAKKTKGNFRKYLLKSIYCVLHQMGSSFSIIRQAATKSAVEIADACELNGNVKLLIQNNIDYLTYHLTVKLRRNDESVLDVIRVLIKNSTYQTLPNLEDIISSVLNRSSQNFDSPHSLSYLRLFQVFVACVDKRKKINDIPNFQLQTNMNRLTKYLESLSEEGTESECMEEAQREQKPEEISDYDTVPEEPEKPKLPCHLKLTLAVANHCLHYLASKDKCKRIIVLEILNECVWALADWEDHLLPLVHNIWSPLITKFEAISDPLLINRSFTLLCTLAFTAKDFVRTRTLKNVLPTLESFLVKQALKSKLKDSASGYYFTQNFKLQRELLSCLGKLTSSLVLFEKQTDLVVDSALPYLSALQPRELQEKCKTLFEDLMNYDKQLVWYKVHGLVKNSEFTKNAEIVLKSLK